MAEEKKPARNRATRFKNMVRDRFLVRFHMGLILSAVFLSGLLTSKILLTLKITSMPLRYGIAVVVGFLCFFLCIRIWLWYVRRNLEGQKAAAHFDGGVLLDGEALGEVADMGLDAAVGAASDSSGGGGGSGGSSGGGGDGGSGGSSGGFSLDFDEGGAILIVLAIVVAVLFGVGIYLVWQAPLILSEAAFQLILATALRRRGKRVDSPEWAGSVFKSTWLPALIVLIVAVVAGIVIQEACPGSTKLSEALKMCVFKN